MRGASVRPEAAAHGEADYRDTYAEVNLTAQHMFSTRTGPHPGVGFCVRQCVQKAIRRRRVSTACL